MPNSLALANEIVRITALRTLSEAARSESLSDLLEAQRNVLEARLGKWNAPTEERALSLLATAIEDDLDDDSSEESLLAYLATISC